MDRVRILFVDDELGVLNALKRSLRKAPYEMVFLNDPQEVMPLLEKEVFHILVSDHKMPEMTGTALFIEVKEKYPKMIRVLMSGFADMSIMVEAINQGEVFRFIPKPWENEDIEATLKEAVAAYNRCAECPSESKVPPKDKSTSF